MAQAVFALWLGAMAPEFPIGVPSEPGRNFLMFYPVKISNWTAGLEGAKYY